MVTGIIAEYNPFHKGHEYHLKQAKINTNADSIVCVMSGSFMQRGIPAIIDKWKRTEMALKNGVDLVIELPLVYSLSSAEHFAFGAISLLNSLNIIDNLYFGSEEGNVKILEDIASILVNEPNNYKIMLKNYLNLGLPFHLSRANALSDFFKSNHILEAISSSNNILGIEYIKALKALNSNIIPLTLKREGSKYNDQCLNTAFSSATSIRNHLKNKNLDYLKDFLPEDSYKILYKLSSENNPFIFEESMFKYIKYKLITDGNSIKNLPDISEGLDNKILKEVLKSNSLDELILNSKSKRYTYTRLNRILTQFFLGLEKYDLLKLSKDPCPYCRVLGFNSKGKELLKNIKKNSTIDIITKVPQNNINECLEIDLLGTRGYSILNPKLSPMQDYLTSPIIL
ncbi:MULTISPECIES: nucleotidyltransferase [Clostridium]|uniref:nucleotidyltransferase n=1 Tax=Clostridium TaxID=1485 RepID=UPI0013F039CC|nr:MULTISPECIES: nucleotidyltransferase [Clostridium]MBN1041542.1 nucleotidyltransferase [Clostridium botulinum]MBY6836032.1 nucleotidyltransferase [Clostridium botulinum]MBY6917556.1 nucleotidyltransferase [Clostridium botulinum]MBY7024487.1 nucleotidyltransferase [Clostridium botulinum]NFG66710.1 nucleotidyltransferase [Clostridium botulinum]